MTIFCIIKFGMGKKTENSHSSGGGAKNYGAHTVGTLTWIQPIEREATAEGGEGTAGHHPVVQPAADITVHVLDIAPFTGRVRISVPFLFKKHITCRKNLTSILGLHLCMYTKRLQDQIRADRYRFFVIRKLSIKLSKFGFGKMRLKYG